MQRRTRATGQNREGLEKVRVVRNTGNGKYPVAGGANPQRGEEPYEGNWISRVSEMGHGGQSAGIRLDSGEGLNRKRGSQAAERRGDSRGEEQTAWRWETVRRETQSRDCVWLPRVEPSSGS